MANKDLIIDPYKIHLQSVKVISGSLKIDPEVDQSKIVEFKTGYEVSHGIAPETNSVRFIFTVKFEAINEQRETIPVSAEYTMEFIFMVDNLDSFIEVKQERINFDTNMAATLVGILYSTARGIILSRTQGSLMDGVILPVMSPKDLLVSDTK
ncbi:MAG: hypothetical protein O9353_15755 [Bacteroidia bacterium]|nr:hypothetical protein [Bacteroidia bacterium]